MKTLFSVFFILLFYNNSFCFTIYPSQTDSIKEKIQLINNWLAILDTLSPFSENDNDILLIDSLNEQVSDYLIQILNNKNIVKYKVDSLLHLNTTKSSDNKVFVFSFFENTGGSYKSNINIIYYRLPNGRPKAERLMICEQNDGHGGANYGGAIDKIIILLSNNKTKYLCSGGGIGCNTCEFNYTVLLSITDNSLTMDFCLLLDYRQGDGTVSYNTKTKILSFDYTLYMDDSLYGTDCSDGQIIMDNRCKHSGQYKFNGNTFEFVTKK